MNVGLHFGVPAEVYHADCADEPSLSNSTAKTIIGESLRKAWFQHPRLNPKYVRKEDDKFDIGTCTHSVLLENDATKIVIAPFDDWRKKDAQEIRKAARAVGKVALLERHYDAVRTMADVALAFIEATEIAEFWHAGQSEVTGIAKDGGVWMRCRFDRLNVPARMILDYKSTTDASPEVFSRQIVRMKYHVQDAFYRRMARILTGEEFRFVFIAQSDEEPYECSLHGCDPALQEIGDAEVQRAIDLWKQCRERNVWPSYGPQIHWALPPSYLISEHELRMAA